MGYQKAFRIWTSYIFYTGSILMVFFLVYIFIRPTKEPIPNTCKLEKAMSYKGKVVAIVRDSFNLSQSFILLANRDTVLPQYTYGLWNEVHPGDSLIKLPNTLNYIIFRNSDTSKKRILNWDRECP
jgi:hypothetical protein